MHRCCTSLLFLLLLATPAVGQDRVIVSVKHVLGGILNARSIGLFTFDFEIREAFRQMNDLLEEEGVSWRLELDEIVDLPGVEKYYEISTDDVGSFEDDALSDPDKYKWRDDAINVYLVDSIEGAGGVCSFPHDNRHEEIVVIANGLFDGIAGAAAGWLHEIGHYLSLLHTFEGGDDATDCTGAGARHYWDGSRPCPDGWECGGGYAYERCPDTCPDDDNIMSYNDLFVFFNIFGDLTACQKRSMNYELYNEAGSRSHVLVRCEDACREERTACNGDCRASADRCRGACNIARDICYGPCTGAAETCLAGCFVGLGACDVGCEVFCLFAPNSDACKDCRSACRSARSSCESACESTRRGCRSGCDGIARGCRSLCDEGPCEADCTADHAECTGDCPERPIGPPGMISMTFRRGDVNGDQAVDISDGSFVLDFLFDSGPPPPCTDAADIDDSGELQLTDAIRLFGYLFLGLAEPVTPGPHDCGADPTGGDPLGCVSFPGC